MIHADIRRFVETCKVVMENGRRVWVRVWMRVRVRVLVKASKMVVKLALTKVGVLVLRLADWMVRNSAGLTVDMMDCLSELQLAA